MTSRRLTENEKAKLIEHSDLTMLPMTDSFVDSTDGSEFHEGMAAGLLLAMEIIAKNGGLNSVSAAVVTTCVARCIQESKA